MKKTITSVLLVSALLFTTQLFSQNVGIGTATPDASSQLEVSSSNKGILIPRVALTASNVAAPVSSPSNSLIIYNTAIGGVDPYTVTPGFYFWNSSSALWIKLVSSSESLWNTMGTYSPATDFADDIYHLQRVTIGGFGNTAYNARLHVDIGGTYDLGFLVSGNANAAAVLPNIGAGSRMLYYPGKSVFRAGYVTGTQWDELNTGRYSVAMGYNALASGQYSFSLGRATAATVTGSFAMGDSSAATGIYSLAFGYRDSAKGGNSTAIGMLTKASGFASFAAGASTYTYPFSSPSYSYSIASGYYSTALAGGTASGEASFSAGYSSVASSYGDFAIGLFSNASGGYSFAGPSSTSDGYSSLALNGGHSFGLNSNAIGVGSFSPGNTATAIGAYDTAREFSVAIGFGAYARTYRSMAVGIYNDSVITSSATTNITTDPVFIIGNGTSPTNRSNAMVVYKNANADINGYTQLGESSPAIKMKKLTVNTPAAQGGFTFVAHGLTQSKILSISALVTVPGGYQIIPNHEQAGYKYTLNVDNANIAVGAVSGNSGSILNMPVKILIVYEE